MARQVTLASISSKAVHSLIQQLDGTAVEANRLALLDAVNSQPESTAALLLENLGIDHWFQLQVTFSVNGEEAALALIHKFHNELPMLLELDQMEETRAEKHAGMIVFSSEEQAGYTESLDMLNVSSTNELAARTDEGDPYVPTDSARLIEYSV
ncbi:hypothetical protein R1flu_018742 [Riccia fluitans]|uniref:Uncharacterized protein n=1 Tax=Riccia fluitans TaxID=41844 RepID=A0ABD1ZKL5_9MARC